MWWGWRWAPAGSAPLPASSCTDSVPLVTAGAAALLLHSRAASCCRLPQAAGGSGGGRWGGRGAARGPASTGSRPSARVGLLLGGCWGGLAVPLRERLAL